MKSSPTRRPAARDALAVDLSAVIVSVSGDQPKVLSVSSSNAPDALPSGPLEVRHRTLEGGLRSWVEEQTRQSLGYVEQLYTFGDRDRLLQGHADASRVLSIGYLALVREARHDGAGDAEWKDWYRYFPWEDHRAGQPKILDRIERLLRRWVADAGSREEKLVREQRLLFPGQGERFLPGDVVIALLQLPDEARLLRAFTPLAADDWRSSQQFFGEFILDGHVRVADVVAAYGIAAAEISTEQTLAVLLRGKLGKRFVVGDRLKLDRVTLTVREVDGDRVRRVGLKLASDERR